MHTSNAYAYYAYYVYYVYYVYYAYARQLLCERLRKVRRLPRLLQALLLRSLVPAAWLGLALGLGLSLGLGLGLTRVRDRVRVRVRSQLRRPALLSALRRSSDSASISAICRSSSRIVRSLSESLIAFASFVNCAWCSASSRSHLSRHALICFSCSFCCLM